MITTLQIGARLMRFLKGVHTLGDLPNPEKAALIDAINFGLGEFLAMLPDHRLSTPKAWTLRAPITQNISIVSGATGFSYESGSSYPDGGYLTENDAIGHSVTLVGDPRLNLLNRSAELLVPYSGGTGTTTMTIHGDAVNLGETDQRVLSEVALVESTGASRPLVHLAQQDHMPFTGLNGYRSQITEFGTPEFWFVTSHLGNERTSSPLWHLRVWPIPLVECTLRARLRSFPASLTFADLQTARNLPLTIEEEPLLLALIAPGLRTSAFLADHVEKSDLDLGADRARLRLAEMQRPRHSQPALCRTRRGF